MNKYLLREISSIFYFLQFFFGGFVWNCAVEYIVDTR